MPDRWTYADYHRLDLYPSPRERYNRAAQHLQELSEELDTERASGPHSQSSNNIAQRIAQIESWMADMQRMHPSLRGDGGYRTLRVINPR